MNVNTRENANPSNTGNDADIIHPAGSNTEHDTRHDAPILRNRDVHQSIRQDDVEETEHLLPKANTELLDLDTDFRGLGEEEVVFLRPTRDADSMLAPILVLYAITTTYIFMISRIVLAITVIIMYKKDSHPISLILISMIFVYVAKTFANVLFTVASWRYNIAFSAYALVKAVKSSTYSLTLFGLYLYLNGLKPWFLYFAIGHATVNLVAYFIIPNLIQFTNTIQVLELLEAVQIVYLAFRLQDPGHITAWRWLLLYYSVVYTLQMVFGLLSLFFGTISFALTLVMWRWMLVLRSTMVLVAFILLNYGLITVINYLFYVGFRRVATSGEITTTHLHADNLNEILYNAAVSALYYYSLLLVSVTYMFMKLRPLLPLNTIGEQLRTLNITSFANEMPLGLQSHSGTYFTSRKAEKPNFIGELARPEQDCILCYVNPNEIVFRPCGHSGYCRPCILEYLKERDICPMCKAPIDGLYVFHVDEESNKMFAKEAIQIKH